MFRQPGATPATVANVRKSTLQNLRSHALLTVVIAIQMLSGGGCIATMPDMSFEGTLRVRAVDTGGNPVADVEVLARGEFDESFKSLGRTGRDGNFQKANMFVGSTRIRVEPPAGVVTAPNQANPVRVDIEGDKTTRVVFRLSRSPA